jgi:hypothetical protein
MNFKVHAFALIYPLVCITIYAIKHRNKIFCSFTMDEIQPSIGRPVKTYPQKLKLKIREKIGPAQPQQL